MTYEAQDAVKEFMAAVDSDMAKTNETKAAIRDHVEKFAAFLEAQANAPAPEDKPAQEEPAPVNETSVVKEPA